jgi:hypothetical protein
VVQLGAIAEYVDKKPGDRIDLWDGHRACLVLMGISPPDRALPTRALAF